MKDIYRVFGLEWPPLQSETPQGATADPESSMTLTTGDKPSSPKQDQSQSKSEIIKEKSSLDKPGSEAMAEEPKVWSNAVVTWTTSTFTNYFPVFVILYFE